MNLKLKLPKLGRGYGMLSTILGFGSVLVCFAIYQNPGQTNYYMGWWKDLVVWTLPFVIAAKELPKFATAIRGNRTQGVK